jgi:hypothetical protein
LNILEDGLSGFKTTESGQPSLFSEGQIIEFEAQRNGVGCLTNQGLAAEVLLDLVQVQPGVAFENAAPLVMEQVPVRETRVKDIVVGQRKPGLILGELRDGHINIFTHPERLHGASTRRAESLYLLELEGSLLCRNRVRQQHSERKHGHSAEHPVPPPYFGISGFVSG